jgi:hypothetical protein
MSEKDVRAGNTRETLSFSDGAYERFMRDGSVACSARAHAIKARIPSEN